MHPQYEKQLEAEIERELKGLPELQAPETLMARVMARIEHPVAVPWYRRAWPSWPLPVQIAALAVLLAVLGGACYGAWEFTGSAELAVALQKVGRMFSGVTAIWSAISAVCGTLVLAIKQLGTGILTAILALVLLAWMACFGLGTVYVRLALARR